MRIVDLNPGYDEYPGYDEIEDRQGGRGRGRGRGRNRNYPSMGYDSDHESEGRHEELSEWEEELEKRERRLEEMENRHEERGAGRGREEHDRYRHGQPDYRMEEEYRRPVGFAPRSSYYDGDDRYDGDGPLMRRGGRGRSRGRGRGSY